ncbi:MAG: NADH-quinone oxidoreductase subunit D [Candidatus Odinarchaeota archaeon]
MSQILKAIKTILGLAASKPMTFSFPPDMPLTELHRGRQFYKPELCKGCKICSMVCPNNAILMVEREKSEENKTGLQPQIDFRKCCFCGLCVDNCPTGALSFTNFPILLTMKPETLNYTPEMLAIPPTLEHPEPPKIKNAVSWARSRSIWIINYMTGCCFIEAVPWVASSFDMERFGLIAVGSPRHADAMIVGGYVTPKTLKRIIRIYSLIPQPKWVISLGNCPMTGGTYWDSYNTIKDISKYIPVDIWIAGCPPRPEPIGVAVVHAIQAIQGGYNGKEEKTNTDAGKMKLPTYTLLEADSGQAQIDLVFGSQHSASGNFNMSLTLDGEVVVDATPNPGYLHRGFEKLMEYRTWIQNIMLVPRICVLDGASYELAYSGVSEKLASIEVPLRGQYLRVIQAELSRIQSHQMNLGFGGAATGFDTNERIIWGDRDQVLLLLEELTGARIYHIFNTIGGVRRDIQPDFHTKANQLISYLRKRLQIYDDLFFHNKTFIDRTQGIGVLTQETAIANDVTGPNLRATGVNFDIRTATPYEAYKDIGVKVVTATKGDAYHRFLCRRQEIEESLNIIERALDKLPSGPVCATRTAEDKKITWRLKIPQGEAFHIVEAGRGELCFHAISTGENIPYRVKVRGPTFGTILVMFPKLLHGVKIADVPVVYWSLDQCPADHDR